MNPIQKNWIIFKTSFRTAHRELEETGKLTMEAAGYHQDKLGYKIVSHMTEIQFPYQPRRQNTPQDQIQLQPLFQTSNQHE